MKSLFLCVVAGALLGAPVLAQPQRGEVGNFGAQNGAVFQLPPGVQNVVSIDALNTIIIAADGERDGETQYTPALIKHVYSGGIARLFGGTAVPTAQFATPGLINNGATGNNGFNAQNNGANNFNNPTNNGFGNNGFGNDGFGNDGFGNGAVFQNGVLGGNGFRPRNQIVASVRER